MANVTHPSTADPAGRSSMGKFPRDRDGAENKSRGFDVAPRKKSDRGPEGIVDRIEFKVAVGLLITAYALTVGLRANSDDPNGRKWIMLETLFATCFTLEMSIRVYAEGWRSYLRNNWSKLDIVLVAVQWVDVVVSAATSVKILSVFGALRVLRLMQVITIGPGYRELWIVVNVMQQLLGIMCESAQVCSRNNEVHALKIREMEDDRIVEALKTVFLTTDTDGSGVVDREEIRASLKDDRIRALLNRIDILSTDVMDLCIIMDEVRGINGGIDADEFLKKCLLLRGDARGRDLIPISVAVEAAIPRFERVHIASCKRQARAELSSLRPRLMIPLCCHLPPWFESQSYPEAIDALKRSTLSSSGEDIKNDGLRRVASIASTLRTHHLVRVWGYVPDVGPLFYPNTVLRRQFSDSELLGSPIARGISERVRACTTDITNGAVKVEPVLDNPGDWMWWSPVEGTEGGNRGFVDRVEEQLEHGYIPEVRMVVDDDDDTQLNVTAQSEISTTAIAPRQRKQFMQAGGIRSSVFNLTTATLGAGALSLPYAFRNSGYLVASLCLLVCGSLSVTTIGYIQDCMDVSRCQTFEKLAFSCSSNPARGRRQDTMSVLALLAIISVITFCFGTAVGYLITLGQIGYTIGCALLSFPLPTTAEGAQSSSGTDIMLCILVLVILYPLCLAEKVSELRIPSLVGVMSVFLLVFVIIFEAIMGGHRMEESMMLPLLPACGWPGVVRTMSLVTFAFACQPNVPAIYAELKESETRRRCRATRMRSVAFWAVFICLGVYFGVGVAGVYTWGFDTKDNILYNYNPLFKDSFDVTIAFIGMAIAIVAAYPLCIFPARFGLESALLVLYPSRFDSDDSGRASRAVVILLTAMTVLLSLGCAILAPSMAQVFELVGSTSGALTCYILPSYFYICLVTGNRMTLKAVKAWSVMLIGIVFAFIGTGVAIKDMIK
ncbi:amino acid transporter, putative [Perkinsus marinus ATCC 50983]|uniref:Amino acid transporter, putative n=1 Tax=Perkinsus marinus (strain ATCC 50983 / TXsc) TaxID=423536 RepID=C5L190_PERM5|nr:amino acid transporter, putative [Perkinsus marinus ATCC 50983]EER09497.1 amino acid transporter, putative [Perkinsus marinus ATCC 50983]|eukprot:XP_002777681.1 amino acid transporter, putative [Perkinsus marinus ATCC 50983]